MGKNVFANGMEIAHEAGQGKVVAAFPDVCMSPPSPPAGPLPVPYPDSSMAKDLQKGSTSVLIGGKAAALRGLSFYKSSPLGNEAATRSFGAGVVTHQITGKTYFQAWSMDVTFEGKNVCRHLDITTSNHSGEQPGETPPMPNIEAMNLAQGQKVDEKEDDKPRCPCCKGDAHPNQVDKDGKLLPTMKEEDYYAKNTGYLKDRREEMKEVLASGSVPGWALSPCKDANPKYNGLPTKDAIINKGNDAEKIAAELKELRSANKNCPNVHEPPDTDCGTHFDPRGDTAAARKQFESIRLRYIKNFKKAHPGSAVTNGTKINHKTPLDAGGCPVSENNLIPDTELSGPCRTIEDHQTFLQGQWRSAMARKK
jgi:uncharacterized Zn-binding protein involved in type VI secretion